MEMHIAIICIKAYMVIVTVVMVVYILRHFVFSLTRINDDHGAYYHDVLDAELPSVSVMVPMHNEEQVARQALEMLAAASYPRDRYEIIPINDHSTDRTGAIIDECARQYPFIHPLHRANGMRGKPAALNEALERAQGDIIVVFDADYRPPKGVVRDIAVTFKDPEVGAVMGRVIPENAETNLLTKLLSLERSAGYQVDQQARYNLGLTPQYGGTVGGFRKEVAVSLGGFSPEILTEDTELTFKLIINGWRVVYNNRVECYEEVPEDWDVRARQIRRWAHGHTQVMFRYLLPLLRSPRLPLRVKIDGALLLCIYIIPVLLGAGIFGAMMLFFLNEMQLLESVFLFLAIAGFNMFGNFAPFYQIGVAALIDGFTDRIRLLPFVLFNFMFNLYYTATGAVAAVFDTITGRVPVWQKTERYRKSA